MAVALREVGREPALEGKEERPPSGGGAQEDEHWLAHALRPNGLLKADGVVTITGAALDYDGEAGTATYSGRAALSQGGTAIHADTRGSHRLQQVEDALRRLQAPQEQHQVRPRERLG